MRLEEAKLKAIDAMKKAVQEGEFTEEEGENFIETVNNLKESN
jgi:hypothetical protein